MASDPLFVLNLFYENVQKQPNSTAIVDGDNPEHCSLTYQQLHNASDHLAWLLHLEGVGVGSFVPIITTRRDMALGVFAILKCRACYIPMDPESWDLIRIQQTIERLRATVILVSEIYIPQFSNITTEKKQQYKIVKITKSFLNSVLHSYDHRVTTILNADSHDVAYIIFTSGTTGQPKGVMVSVQSISAFIRQGDENLPFSFNSNQNARVLFVVSPSFDGKLDECVSPIAYCLNYSCFWYTLQHTLQWWYPYDSYSHNLSSCIEAMHCPTIDAKYSLCT
jgi:non-ribosomal peptide synthetase component F